MKTLAGLLLLAMCSTVSAQPRQAPKSSEVEADGCLGRTTGRFELTNSFWWVVYFLTGKTAGLENHIGDELKVRGIEVSPGSPSEPSRPQDRVPPTLQVSSVDVVTRKNPKGVPPVVGSLASWVSYHNPDYGVTLRYPSTFGDARSGYTVAQSNFAGEAVTTDRTIVSVSVPEATYPDSNYVDGNFAVSVNPKITSEGTCKQFRTFWPEHTGATTVNGITYSRTLGGDGVAAGTAYAGYQFHTFQNGLCYEFSFGFAEGNGGGMDVPCSIQWVSEENNFELMRAILSQVTFSKPQLDRAGNEVSQRKTVPFVTSFEHEPVASKPAGRGQLNMVTISWNTTDADYVQIRYPCTKSLYASTTQSPGYSLGKCGNETDVNLPPNGSMSLLLSNFNPAPVELVLTLEPFRGGVGFPKEAKTISFTAPPHDPVPAEGNRPVPQAQ